MSTLPTEGLGRPVSDPIWLMPQKSSSLDARWYVASTRSRHEKMVGQQLTGRGIEFYLPLASTRSTWKDRKVTVDLPLFPGYIFVRIPWHDRLGVLQTPGVVNMVGTCARAGEVSSQEIENLKLCLQRQGQLEPHPYLPVGQLVRIKQGAFRGMMGRLARYSNQYRLVMTIEAIQRSVALEVDSADIEAIT